MISLKGKNIAIIGGGSFCYNFLRIMADEDFINQMPVILGVADKNTDAEGIKYAAQRGIFTTNDYNELFRLKDLDVIIELTRDNVFIVTLRKEIPPEIRLIDHFEAVFLWNSLLIEREKIKILKELPRHTGDIKRTTELFNKYSDQLVEIFRKRTAYSLNIERDLVENESAISQIVEGSATPTLVINKDHIIIHWNKALENLTGLLSKDMLGTDKQWLPFRSEIRSEKRPIMADLIIDGVKEEDIFKYYTTKWQRSPLIEGGYEAEEFFPQIGESGKWIFLTAAPIRGPNGIILGAIETLWDKTAEKKAEEERERHNRELAASERFMSQIVEGSTIPTFVINSDHIVTHWNKALAKFTGFNSEEMVGTNKQSIPFWRKERPTLADIILDQTDESEIEKLYGGTYHKSSLIEGACEAETFFPSLGEWGKWCWFTAAPIKAPDGTIIGAIETLWDTTEKRHADEEREKYTRELSTLCSIYSALNSPSDLNAMIDEAIEEVKKFLSADIICIYLLNNEGKLYLWDCKGISDKDDIKIHIYDEIDLISQVAKRNEYQILEDSQYGSGDGVSEKNTIRSQAFIPMISNNMGVIGVIRIGSRESGHFSYEQKKVLELIGNRIGVAIENSRLQQEYIKSEKKYRTLFENNPHSTFILDETEFKILDANERAQHIYRYSREELLGIPFLRLCDENDDEISEGLATLGEDKSKRLRKKRNYRKGAIPFYVNLNFSLTKYGESRVIIASATDITESVEKEAQLIQAGKMTTLGVMAAGMAHEINQPLNVIQVCADFFLKMLRKGRRIEDDDLRSMANDIVANVKRATDVIKHVRDFARQSEVVKDKVNINKPIEDVFKVLGHQTKVHEIEVELDLDPNLPFIKAEHNRLEQVFINLITNSIDAIDEKKDKQNSGNIEKRLKIKSYTENGQVVVTVSDTGIGMTEEVKKKIFEPFFTTKKIGKGTGLGISISYGIVKDYEGTITAESEEGKGTTFYLRFPALHQNSEK